MRGTQRVALALAAALALAGAAPAGVAWQGAAAGKFESRDLWFEIGDAYAFRSDSLDDDGSGLLVAVTNAELDRAGLDRYFDRRYIVNTFIDDDETYVAWFELSPDGEYRGLSYFLESGNGCGWCFSTSVASTVKRKGERLVGKLSYRDDALAFDVALDVPIASDERGTPVGAGGGEPGRVYAAFHEALLARDRPALQKLFGGKLLASWNDYAKESPERADGFLAFLRGEHHAETIRVSEAFVRGDRALVLAAGEARALGKVKGEALLDRERGTWRVMDETWQLGSWDLPGAPGT